MDELQRKHLIDRLDIVINEVRSELENEIDDSRVDDLNDRIGELKDDLEKCEDDKRDAEIERDDYKSSLNKVKLILEDMISSPAGEDYYQERINEALELL